jgi:hypothetical protein
MNIQKTDPFFCIRPIFWPMLWKKSDGKIGKFPSVSPIFFHSIGPKKSYGRKKNRTDKKEPSFVCLFVAKNFRILRVRPIGKDAETAILRKFITLPPGPDGEEGLDGALPRLPP